MNIKIVLSCALVILISILGFQFFCSGTNPTLFIQNLLDQADIAPDGDRPWDITIHNDNLYARIVNQGSLGLGEAYMDGWWDCKALDQLFYKILRSELDSKVRFNWTLLCIAIKAKLMNLQTKNRSLQVAELHYDLSNELFSNMLDPLMIYSCGYWQHANNLAQAQEDKLELICKKLELKKGMKLLDIGCGWGGLAYYAAKHYGVEVTGITISKEQAQYAREFCKGLPVTILLEDYRDLHETFDRIVSVGMFEHVGYKNYREFMTIAHACLKDDGLFLLHTIGSNVSSTACDPWILKYIFPNGMLPSIAQIGTAMECLFVMEDWHNFSADYDKTLMAWHANFEKAWPTLKTNYDERFYRMWNYYLLSCAGLFRARKAQLWQIVLSKHGILGGYRSVR